MPKSFTFAINCKPQIIACMLFLQFFILISSTQNLQSVEIINYNNPYSGITGIYDSQDYGLVFSNSTGIFSLDKSTGELKELKFSLNQSFFSFDNIFEFNGELYFYHTHSNLFVYRNGQAISIATSIVAHYCKDDTIYLIRGNEPRLQILTAGTLRNFYLNDSEGMHLTAYYFEYNNEIYGFINLNWSGNVFIFKMTDSGPEFIMAPHIDKYNAFMNAHPRFVRIVDGEFWITCISRTYKLFGNELVLLDEDFPFRDRYIRDLLYENSFVYVLTSQEFSRVDISNNEEKKIYNILEQPIKNIGLFKGENLFYLVINNSAYTYNPINEEFSELQVPINERVVDVIEGRDEMPIILRYNKIEWYKQNPPTVFGGPGNYTNRFYDVDFDILNNRIVALGQVGKEFIIQFFDGINWDYAFVPYEISNEMVIPNANLKVDLNGNVYVSVDDFFGLYDDNNWERISFIENPDIPDIKQSESYSVMLRDSSGGLWVAAYLDTFSVEKNRSVKGLSIWRYYNGNRELITESIPAMYLDPNTRGICKQDGAVIIDIIADSLYVFKNYEMSVIKVSDGIDKPFTNTDRNLSLSSENKLIINFANAKGWDIKYGNYWLMEGISEYDNGVWNHIKWADLARQFGLNFQHSLNIYDMNRNNWILTPRMYLRVNLDGTYSTFPIKSHLINVSPFSSAYIQSGNTIWLVSSTDGLHKVVLPTYTTVQDNELISNYIINPVVTGSHLELTEEVRSYSIFSLTGQEVARGSHASIIDVELLSSGIYFIKAETYEETFINKFQIAK